MTTEQIAWVILAKESQWNKWSEYYVPTIAPEWPVKVFTNPGKAQKFLKLLEEEERDCLHATLEVIEAGFNITHIPRNIYDNSEYRQRAYINDLEDRARISYTINKSELSL